MSIIPAAAAGVGEAETNLNGFVSSSGYNNFVQLYLTADILVTK